MIPADMKFNAFYLAEFESLLTNGKSITLNNILFTGRKNSIIYGPDPDEKSIKEQKILKYKELPQKLYFIFQERFINKGYTIKEDGWIVVENYLFNLNILPGDKFFELKLSKRLMSDNENFFNIEKPSDILDFIIEFDIHILKQICFENDNTVVYKDINNKSIQGEDVLSYSPESLELFMDYSQKLFPKVKLFNK